MPHANSRVRPRNDTDGVLPPPPRIGRTEHPSSVLEFTTHKNQDQGPNSKATYSFSLTITPPQYLDGPVICFGVFLKTPERDKVHVSNDYN